MAKLMLPFNTLKSVAPLSKIGLRIQTVLTLRNNKYNVQYLSQFRGSTLDHIGIFRWLMSTRPR